MPRWWVSWWSGNYADEGCSAPPFQFWDSGHRSRSGIPRVITESTVLRDEMSLCAVVDAGYESEIWEVVFAHFPDAERRFCHKRPSDFMPGDRFPNFQNRTSLYAPATP